jgi:polyisoprenoid-binding protein YceI
MMNHPATRSYRTRACPVLVSVILAIVLLCMAGIAAATEPCQPFEARRVDQQILQSMREAARAGRLYRVLPGVSRVSFCVRHFPFSEFRGQFRDIVGGLVLPPAMDESGQALMLVHTTDMESTNPGLDEVVLGHNFIDAENFPEILFVGQAFHWHTPLTGHIHGELTLRGITRPIVISVEIDVVESDPEGKIRKIRLNGKGQVNRTNYDMLSHRLVVSETVQLCLAVELELWTE